MSMCTAYDTACRVFSCTRIARSLAYVIDMVALLLEVPYWHLKRLPSVHSYYSLEILCSFLLHVSLGVVKNYEPGK